MTAFSVDIFREPDRSRQAFESALDEIGGRIPLTARMAWARRADRPAWLIGVRHHGAPVFGVGLETARSRAAPLFQIWRVPRLGGPGPVDASIAACEELVHLARTRRVLRVVVEIVDRDPARRRVMGDGLTQAGFVRTTRPRNYTATPVVDLTRPESELLAAMRPRGRRHLRATARHGFRVERLEADKWAPTLARISAETWDRTGGRMPFTDWPTILKISRDETGPSEVLGLFGAWKGAPEGLLAFGWGCFHGDHAHYEAGGSLRLDGGSPPLTYALVWELIRWARARHATWFDLGGVPGTPDDPASGHSLKDIVQFKRSFGGVEQEVGEAWEFSPRPAMERLAGALGAFARRFRR